MLRKADFVINHSLSNTDEEIKNWGGEGKQGIVMEWVGKM